MLFSPYVIRKSDGLPVNVKIIPATSDDLAATHGNPHWQTDWDSAYLSNPAVEKYAMKTPDGELMAFGIKFSIDNGCRGDVVFDAKTDELAKHYVKGFYAKQIPSAFSGGPKRFMLADEDAWHLFSEYLAEEG